MLTKVVSKPLQWGVGLFGAIVEGSDCVHQDCIRSGFLQEIEKGTSLGVRLQELYKSFALNAVGCPCTGDFTSFGNTTDDLLWLRLACSFAITTAGTDKLQVIYRRAAISMNLDFKSSRFSCMRLVCYSFNLHTAVSGNYDRRKPETQLNA